ncbi:MAG: cell division protein FtsZ [Bryobacterales bacterium]|nr:cell division protein FtsZ [Bryobacterales bacterium]
MLNLESTINQKFEIADDMAVGTRIKVLGIGGGGCNAVARMMDSGLTGVEFYAINTDRQALLASPVPNKLAIGAKVTNGLGAGSDPAVGRQAALEDTERIIEILEGADMVFVAAGLGGGTGTGAAPVVASLAKELNALTVAIVTKPFRFEGARRQKIAERGLGELAGTVDTVITIPNSRLLEIVPPKTSFLEAFRLADDVLLQAVQGISDIINTPGLINRDFADIRAIMVGMGYAMMSTAAASGDNALAEAARKAISNPLLEDGGVRGARAILINVTCSNIPSIQEIDEACLIISEASENPEAQINYGMVFNEELGDEVKLTVIATGFQREGLEAPQKSDVPQLAKRAMAASVGAPAPIPVYVADEPPVQIGMDEEPEPITSAFDSDDLPREAAPEPVLVAESAPAARGETNGRGDIETPAFIRRDRRFFQ